MTGAGSGGSGRGGSPVGDALAERSFPHRDLLMKSPASLLVFCYAAPAMDDVWLNRAGILAEAVSFILIAPEIIGLARLRGLERRLEAWLKDNSGFRYSGRIIVILFCVSSAFALWIAFVPDYLWDQWITNIFWIIVFLLVLSLLAPFPLWLVIRTAEHVLAGKDRLRTLVFGTGVVLLFGGMATQFWATF